MVPIVCRRVPLQSCEFHLLIVPPQREHAPGYIGQYNRQAIALTIYDQCPQNIMVNIDTIELQTKTEN